MHLNRNTNVFFDELSHVYLLGDKELIGVTSLMKKHGLGADYSGISQKVLDAAAAEGTAIHKEIEDYDNGKAVLISPLIQEYKSLGLKFIASEYLVSDNETVASSIDGVYEGSANNKVLLVDYKSTQKVHKRALMWQLGIYKVLFERQNPGIEVEETLCLHIDKKEQKIKGLIHIDPVSTEEVDNLLCAERDGRIYIDAYEEPSASIVLSEDELQAYIDNQAKVSELKSAIKEIEAAIKAYDARIIEYMQAHGLDKMDAGGGTLTLKKPYIRTGVDTSRLKAKRPDIYEQFLNETTVSASLIYKSNK